MKNLIQVYYNRGFDSIMANNKPENIQKSRKLLIVGDPMCGKRTLLLALETNQFIPNPCQITFEIPVIPVQINTKTFHMALFNTFYLENYDRLRALIYPGTNIILMCFSVDNPVSLRSIIEKWILEVRRYCDRCPIILVACKTDLRTDPETIAKLQKIGQKPVTSRVGKRVAAQIKADAYMECSSKAGDGLQDLLTQAARLSRRERSHRTVNCQCILQ